VLARTFMCWSAEIAAAAAAIELIFLLIMNRRGSTSVANGYAAAYLPLGLTVFGIDALSALVVRPHATCTFKALALEAPQTHPRSVACSGSSMEWFHSGRDSSNLSNVRQ
jgi:hypothetical protein